MSSINANSISKGVFLLFKGEPHLVTKTEYMSPGKGSPVMRVKFRSVKTGNATEFTYKSGEFVEVVDVQKKEMDFLYRDGSEVYFMNTNTYEQVSAPAALLGDQLKFLTPNLKCQVVWYEDSAIGVNLPPHVVLKVIESPDSIAGNRINAPKKLVKLETGYEVQAPIFIKIGDKLEIDTTTGEYIARVN